MARGKAQTDTQTTDPVDALPNVTLSGSISAVLSEAVENHRWANRMSRADVLNEALTSWAESRDLIDAARKSLADKVSGE
jgi:Arc/MetJ-type ribon-helix-helix transcriptional regulator